MNVRDIVVNKIIESLEKGVVPWNKPWIGKTVNYVSRKPYTGVNTLLLQRKGEYLTWNQIKTLKGTVKKGAKSEIVVFFKMLELEKEDNEAKSIPMLRYYKVFHLSDVEGIETKFKTDVDEKDVNEKCEDIVNLYKDKPTIEHNPCDQAYYSPSEDLINMPQKSQFKKIEGYYKTLFHEMAHSTGHEKRLKRLETASFGSEKYGKEELVAEITASMLCAEAGIDNETIENSASYIDNWLNAIMGDKNLIIQSANKAQKAFDYILRGKEEELKIGA